MDNQANNVMEIANGSGAWIAASVCVVLVLGMAALYARLAFKNAQYTTLSKNDCVKAFRSGLISSIGPSVSVFVLVLSLAAIIGSPMAWMRLSIIGGAATELVAAQTGVVAAGSKVGADNFDVNALFAAWFTMGVNGCGWLLFVVLFNHRMEGIRQKLGQGDGAWLGLLGVAATLGLFGYLSAPYILAFDGKALATVVAAVTMGVLAVVGKKFKWLKEYSLSFAIIIGATIGTVFALAQ